jgi:hypothetical protein
MMVARERNRGGGDLTAKTDLAGDRWFGHNVLHGVSYSRVTRGCKWKGAWCCRAEMAHARMLQWSRGRPASDVSVAQTQGCAALFSCDCLRGEVVRCCAEPATRRWAHTKWHPAGGLCSEREG